MRLFTTKWVVKSFEARGVIFVEDLEEVPSGAPLVFSAHGRIPGGARPMLRAAI